ncbi:class I SAM-dependent methyltransferase [Afifella sp. JA880]|uniref:SAM-dependent methyltransferase n=1 Tax=Afifella sp. JA880 TaxID=2975280 RepID=UPI0021BACE84|nr:class I SAM-dependent methyltransferase [Afifella sp. JA880]MCT8266357.1 class I SAM-dependent methyltransferase [Afifella sp. JA880]
MWDERYGQPGYFFGTEPNAFLAAHADLLSPGMRVLSVADGEGRNGVWMAERGLEVTAIDASAVAIEKSKRLAAERGVSLAHVHADIATWEWPSSAYDVAVAIFVQFANPTLRAQLFKAMKRALLPGGILLLQGYRPEQIGYGTGGPPNPDHLYTRSLLEAAFSDFEIIHLAEHDSEIHEGKGHSGLSALIDLVARKPA